MGRINMNVSGILGGVAGGLVGALVWVLVGYFTGYEVGYIAWGVGLLAGLGLRYFAGGVQESTAQGVAAAVIAIACIVGAKFVVATLQAADWTKEVAVGIDGSTFTDDDMIMQEANRTMEAREAKGKPQKWPDFESETAPTLADYPADVRKEATAQWRKLSHAEQEKAKQELAAAQQQFVAELSADLHSLMIENMFTAWDLLWAFLAVGTAYKIGAGTYANE
jgi:hypothetical protein